MTGMYDRAWLHEFAMETRILTLSTAKQNSCILSTHVGLKVLEHFGVKARAQAVTVYAFNREAWDLSANGVPVTQWPESAWSVGIEGTGVSNQETKAWDGHLALIVSNPNRMRTLIDLTADQLDRPHKGINVNGPVFMDLKPLWSPNDPLFTVTGEEKGTPTIVMYRPLMKAGDWKEAPDWTRDPSDLVEHVIERLKPLP